MIKKLTPTNSLGKKTNGPSALNGSFIVMSSLSFNFVFLQINYFPLFHAIIVINQKIVVSGIVLPYRSLKVLRDVLGVMLGCHRHSACWVDAEIGVLLDLVVAFPFFISRVIAFVNQCLESEIGREDEETPWIELDDLPVSPGVIIRFRNILRVMDLPQSCYNRPEHSFILLVGNPPMINCSLN